MNPFFGFTAQIGEGRHAKGGEFCLIFTLEFAVVEIGALEKEEGGGMLPIGFSFGDIDDFAGVALVFPSFNEGFEASITINVQVLMENFIDGSDAPGIVEVTIEALATAARVFGGEFVPAGGSGEFPEDSIEEEAVWVGRAAGAAVSVVFSPLNEFLPVVGEEGFNDEPVAVCEESARGVYATAEGGLGA